MTQHAIRSPRQRGETGWPKASLRGASQPLLRNGQRLFCVRACLPSAVMAGPEHASPLTQHYNPNPNSSS